MATVLLTACGDTGGSGGTVDDRGDAGSVTSTTPTTTPTPEPTPVDLECPEQLAEAAGMVGPAEVTPTFPRLESAVVCSYFSGESPDGGWERQVGPVDVPEQDLAPMDDALAALRPAPADQMCTMDLGPRVLLLGATADGTVGVVTEAYGCRDVLLTDDPAGTAPGTGASGLAVPGSLAPGADLLALLEPLLR